MSTQIGAAVAAGKCWTLCVKFANRNLQPIKVSVAVTAGGAPADADWVAFNMPVLGPGGHEETGIVVGAGEALYARSDLANVSVRAHGFEESA
ncbi:MAG: hypothetical protein AB7P37_20685 [Ramlibacter sp.]